ncbi:MAG: T9SS type A sorting domain-containing protein [Phaeodactylibacter sp.]|nr:T9SS type A sorting domain-containing protein [Phaeodactylibacter sp.]
MKYIHTFFALFFLPFLLAGQDVITGTLSYDGLERNYRLYIPSANTTGEALPLVFNFHGFGSNAAQQEFYSGMNMVADTAGFFVCYPNGVSNAWNVGWEFGSTADDVGFTNALIDELSGTYNIDPQRIYACGMSNGGFMSYRLACELNNKVAAIASVTGSMVPSYIGSCAPGRAVPVLEVHGTADDVVPYLGQAGLSINIDTVVYFWASNNACNLSPEIQQLPDTAPNDGSTATRIDYNDCTGGHQVSLIRINGGEHTWPGSIFDLGGTNQDINASVEIWRFFNRFTLSGTPSAAGEAGTTPRFRVYPNPTSGMLQFEGPVGPVEVTVFNAFGQLVHRSKLPGGGRLDLSGWQRGVYLIETVTTAGHTVFRVVKE